MQHSPHATKPRLGHATTFSEGPRRRPSQRGVALVTALTLVLTLSMMVLTFLSVSVDNSNQSTNRQEAFRVRSSAESATLLAVDELWSGYLAGNGGQPGSLATFRVYMDGQGIPNHNLVGGKTAKVQDMNKTSMLGMVDLPDKGAGQELAGMRITDLSLTRSDEGNATSLYFRTSVRNTAGDRLGSTSIEDSVQQAFVVEGGEWEGLEYALLANNVNCMFCHARIDNVQGYYNLDPDNFGDYPRVKVGSMEELRVKSRADTTIAGTLYTRGKALDDKGFPVADWSTMDLKSFLFDGDGNIVEDVWGNPTVVDLVPADLVTPAPLENFYIDYAKDEALMVDGFLPDSFPAAFPDNGGVGASGNRIVDAVEYDAVAAGATGSLAGGNIFVSPKGDVISSAAEVVALMSTGNVASLGADTDGNVVLVGTLADPILLNGTIAIDGDLIIKGYVKGEGALFVRGNVYVPSDLQYLDGDVMGDRTYGQATDGTTNALAIAAGGNIVMGNKFYTKLAWDKGTGLPDPSVPLVTGDEAGTFNFLMNEIAIFNRAEWTKAQPVLPGPTDNLRNPVTWGVVNPTYDPDLMPRYYAFAENKTIPIFLDGYYDPVAENWVSAVDPKAFGDLNAYPWDPTDPLLFDGGGNPIASVVTIGATGGWITEDMLRAMVSAEDAARWPGPVQIDSLLYSNNGIFGISGLKESSGGEMVVNGGVVAADVGLLVPTQLNLNYDVRPPEMLELSSDDAIEIRRKLTCSLPGY